MTSNGSAKEGSAPSAVAVASQGVGSVQSSARQARKKASRPSVKMVNQRTFTACMEQLQQGYVLSVAATAGALVEVIDRDLYGLDVDLVMPRGPDREELTIKAQLKNTTIVAPDASKPDFRFQFKKRLHMEHLVKKRTTNKAILLVMATDPDQSRWTAGSHESLATVKCCYWMNLEGATVPNVRRPSVRVPTANVFDAEALTKMFERVAKGEPI